MMNFIVSIISKALLLFFIVLFGFFSSLSQNKSAGNKASRDKQKTPQVKNQESPSPKTLSLLNEARLAPAEFRADALIRLATSRLINNSKLKIELLKEAFDSADDAQFQVKRTLFSTLNTDTRVGFLASAYDLNLDALSLRSRAVDALLTMDKVQAREMFSRIQLKTYLKDSLSCKDPLIYDVRAYYRTLRNIAEKSFSTREIEQGNRTRFIEERIGNITSPVELVPVANLIVALNLDQNELQFLLHLYSAKLKQLSSDYRTFYASEVLYATVEAIEGLMLHAEKKDISSKQLIEAYRDYLIKNLSQKACTDIDDKERQIPHFVKTANHLLFRQNPIAPEDVKTEKGETSFAESPFWTSAKAKLLLNKTRELRFNPNGEELTNTEKQSVEWNNDFLEVINLLADWKAEDEKTIEDYLHQKAIVLRALLEIAPTAKQRNEVIDRFLIFLRDFDITRISRIEWYWHMSTILKQIHNSDGKLRASILERLLNSENPILKLYSSLSVEKI